MCANWGDFWLKCQCLYLVKYLHLEYFTYLWAVIKLKTMKAQELRIGNWVYYKDYEVQFSIDDYAEADNNDQFLALFVKPIPLTEERLEKFGFKHRNDNVWVMDIREDREIRVFIEDPSVLVELVEWDINNSSCISLAFIKYVHQLQNLYFALTGEELEW